MSPSGRRSTVLLPVLILAVACDSDRGRGPHRGDPAAAPAVVEVRAVLPQEPSTLSLIGKSDTPSLTVALQITDSLVQYDGRLQLVPRVAESWEFSEDRRTLTFRLRDGVRWHDGHPVTAGDVVFSVEQAKDPTVENRTFGPPLRDLVSAEAPDDRTVRAVYPRADPDALDRWRLPLIPRHRAERGAALLAGEFSRSPVGCGPFRFVRHRPGEEIVLEANPDYWDGRPRIDRLRFTVLGDERTALQMLLAGELDILALSPALWLEARASPRGAELGSFVYYRLSVTCLLWNQDGSNPFFADPRVRRALVMATDRQRFVDTVLHGLARVAATSYHPDLSWTDPSIGPLPADRDEARRLLDEAGWRDTDGDGKRDRDGRPFAFSLLVGASGQQIVDQMAVWLEQSWAEIGVDAEIEKVEWNDLRQRRDAFRFDAALSNFSTSFSPDQYELYHASQRGAGSNYGGFADAELDRLLERGRETFDPVERAAIYHAVQRKLRDLQPLGYLVHYASPVLHDPTLRGIRASPPDFWSTSEGPRLWYRVDPAAGG